MGWPVAGFHSRTVPSLSALASILPFGLNAMPFTPLPLLMPVWRGTRWAARWPEPQPDRAVTVRAGQRSCRPG